MILDVSKNYFHNISSFLMTSENNTAISDTSQLPPDIVSDWLGKLKLLQGVPFNYLVPDERMLPVESIRFFYLDFNWIYSLVDGAYSIGRSTSGELIFDSAHSEMIHNNALLSANNQRNSTISSIEDIPQVITGFILRSSVVDDFPGIEATAFSNNVELNMLRYEKIMPSILIGMFDGVIDKINFHEPPEGLHFGTDIPDHTNITPADFFKQLKNLAINTGSPVQNTSVTLDYRDINQRVVKINSFANKLKSELISKNIIKTTDFFTSAEFALEMIEGVELVSFQSSLGK